MRNYEILHSQGKKFIVDDLERELRKEGVKI